MDLQPNTILVWDCIFLHALMAYIGRHSWRLANNCVYRTPG